MNSTRLLAKSPSFVALFVSAVLAAAVFTEAVAGQQFTITQTSGTDNFGSRSTGQTFTPNVGINPNPGTRTTIPLSQITLYAGNSGATAPSTTTYLNIYDGDPNQSGQFVASSTNSIDTNGLTFRTPLVWTFAQPDLIYTREYWAVMSSTAAAGGLNIAVSLETEPRNGPPGPNVYTGGAGLIANIAKHPNSVDCRFEIQFFVGFKGSFGVSGRGCPGSAGQGLLSSPSYPQLGQSFRVDIQSAAATALPFLALGLSDTNWNGLPLPARLNIFLPNVPAACQILASPDVFLNMAAGSTATTQIPLPNDPSLNGATFFVQGYQIEGATVSVTAKGTAIVGL